MKGQVHWHQGAGEHPRQHQGVGVHRGRWQHHRALADYHPAHVVPQRWQRKDGATGQRPALPQTQGQGQGQGTAQHPPWGQEGWQVPPRPCPRLVLVPDWSPR